MTAYAVVYHMEGYTPQQILAMQEHHKRNKGDLEHCDPKRFRMNKVIHGNRDTWGEEFLAEVEAYKHLNMRNEVAALNRRGRRKEAARRRIEGGKDPWKKSSELGVVRSILLSADEQFFRQEGFEDFAGADFRDPKVCAEFERLGTAWAEKKIPRKYWLFAVWEYDEKTPHLHLYARAWNEKETKTKGLQRMLQPTDMVHFRNAELAQTEVAEWFAPMGLVRGREIAKARREARARGQMPPQKARRKEPWQWRQDQRMQLVSAEERARAAEAAEEKKRLAAAAEREAVRREREELSRAVVDAEKRNRCSNPTFLSLPRSEIGSFEDE
ncbi:hypothetical protein ACN2XU_24160 [Primorskyibacter sp. 2E107]|uniref:hypothetical protein n=1 Tax=Primorskyibacter sp. 2E107 TaxID=3403458 RepID=UPI003AF9D82D